MKLMPSKFLYRICHGLRIVLNGFNEVLHVDVFSVVCDHNATAAERKVTPINSILCPGLGTAVGCMPHDKAAIQVSLGFSLL